ncbi:MAG: RNA polymerase sigma factor [Vicinamibacterales bacterium]
MPPTDTLTPPYVDDGGALPDEAIIARVLAGEPGLFEALMRRHNARVYRTVRAVLRRDEECEDVMQQTYISAYRHLAGFERHARFSTWLTRIAVNEAIQRTRRVSRRQESPLPRPDGPGPVASAPDPEHAAYAAELGRLLEAAIDALPDPYRVVFALRELEGMSTAEVAETLDLKEDTVKTRLHRARTSLRHQLTSRLGARSPELYAFHLSRCDRVVAGVLRTLDIN